MSRPEEPTEWAGLPGEPLRPRSAAEQLDAEVPDADLLAGTGIASISIPMPDAAGAAPASEPADAPDSASAGVPVAPDATAWTAIQLEGDAPATVASIEVDGDAE